MFSNEQVSQIAATEKQYHILRHVPPGVDPLSVHAGRVPRVYQPNDDKERTVATLLGQIHDLLLRQAGAVRVLCPTAEIKAAVEARLNEHERARLTIELGV
jgi:hypothetical protein